MCNISRFIIVSHLRGMLGTIKPSMSHTFSETCRYMDVTAYFGDSINITALFGMHSSCFRYTNTNLQFKSTATVAVCACPFFAKCALNVQNGKLLWWRMSALRKLLSKAMYRRRGFFAAAGHFCSENCELQPFSCTGMHWSRTLCNCSCNQREIHVFQRHRFHTCCARGVYNAPHLHSGVHEVQCTWSIHCKCNQQCTVHVHFTRT